MNYTVNVKNNLPQKRYLGMNLPIGTLAIVDECGSRYVGFYVIQTDRGLVCLNDPQLPHMILETRHVSTLPRGTKITLEIK